MGEQLGRARSLQGRILDVDARALMGISIGQHTAVFSHHGRSLFGTQPIHALDDFVGLVLIAIQQIESIKFSGEVGLFILRLHVMLRIAFVFIVTSEFQQISISRRVFTHGAHKHIGTHAPITRSSNGPQMSTETTRLMCIQREVLRLNGTVIDVNGRRIIDTIHDNRCCNSRRTPRYAHAHIGELHVIVVHGRHGQTIGRIGAEFRRITDTRHRVAINLIYSHGGRHRHRIQ